MFVFIIGILLKNMGGDTLKREKLTAVLVIAAGLATILLMLMILAYAVDLSGI